MSKVSVFMRPEHGYKFSIRNKIKMTGTQITIQINTNYKFSVK